MKKFVVIDNIGKWEKKDGRTIIDCTVLQQKVVADSNIAEELKPLVSARTRYDDDGTWHSCFITTRAKARNFYHAV